jgi:transposase
MNAIPRPTLADLASKDETILRLETVVARQADVIAGFEAKLQAVTAAFEARIETLLSRIDVLETRDKAQTARIAELEAKLNIPPPNPGNSSVPPSSARKPNGDASAKPRGSSHAGAHRPLHPNPTSRRDVVATRCRCGADVSTAPQFACEEYDRIDLPPIKPDVTRVTLFGGTCPCCKARFKADAPADMPRGSPFGPNLRAFVLYLRFTHGISLERLAHLMTDLLGMGISEGAIVNIISAAVPAFERQTSAIRARLLSGTALESDETGMRVGKKNHWLWVFHHGLDAVFVADPSRARRVVEGFLGEYRPEYWVSDRYGGQLGWATKENQICLAHFIRDARRAVEWGDDVFAPKLILLLQRACRIGRRRERLADATLKTYAWRLDAALDALMDLAPPHMAGQKLQKVVRKVRRHMFVFVTHRDIPATNNGSERALRPAAVFRKITNGFRTTWGVKFYADIRSVVETARRRSIGAFEAIRLTLAGEPLPIAA